MTLSEFNNSNDGTSPGDTFKILMATDIHLGYNETDKIAGNIFFCCEKMAQIFGNFTILQNYIFQGMIPLILLRKY